MILVAQARFSTESTLQIKRFLLREFLTLIGEKSGMKFSARETHCFELNKIEIITHKLFYFHFFQNGIQIYLGTSSNEHSVAYFTIFLKKYAENIFCI